MAYSNGQLVMTGPSEIIWSPVSGGRGGQVGYQYTANGGVNYFTNNGQIITPVNREYAEAYGLNPGQIEGGATQVLGGEPAPTPKNTGGSGYSGPTMAQIAAANAAHQAQLKQIEAARNSGLLDIQDAEAAIAENRNQLKKDLQGGYEGNQSYFSQVSPDAYQSQIKNYDTKVLDAYNTSNTALDRNQARIGDARAAVEAKYGADVANANASLADYQASSGSGGVGSLSYSPAPTSYSQGVAQTATQGSNVGASMQNSAAGQAGGNFWNALAPAVKSINAYNVGKSIVGATGPIGSGAAALMEMINK